jgi:hypothetical protein
MKQQAYSPAGGLRVKLRLRPARISFAWEFPPKRTTLFCTEAPRRVFVFCYPFHMIW